MGFTSIRVCTMASGIDPLEVLQLAMIMIDATLVAGVDFEATLGWTATVTLVSHALAQSRAPPSAQREARIYLSMPNLKATNSCIRLNFGKTSPMAA